MASTTEDDLPEIALTARPAIQKHLRLQFEKAQDSWVLLYPEGMVKLNQSAGEILQRCDGERDVQAVVAKIEEAFEQTGLTDDVVSSCRLPQNKTGYL